MAVLVCLASGLLHADVKSWQTGETIPGTEGVTPGPGVQLDHRNLAYANLSEADLTDADFQMSNLAHAELGDSNLTRANLAYAGMSYSNLANANLTGSSLAYAYMDNSNLTNANLTDAVVSGTRFDDTTSRGFTKEQLYSTASYQAKNLQGITLMNNDLRGWDLSGQNLSPANLNFSDLTNANLRGANLANSGLSATLTNADLTGANLANAFAVAATLINANLSGANLRNANLLDYADLTNTIFSASTVYNQWTRFPDGFNPETEGLTFTFSAAGDLDGIDGLTVSDVDLLRERLRDPCYSRRSGCPIWIIDFEMFDLNSDRVIDNEDLRVWVEDLKGTHFGDADLDGNVSFPDFLALADHFGGPGGWRQGDFDADGTVQFPDFLVLASNYGMTSTASATAVPEPCSALLLIIGVLLRLVTRGR